MAAPRTVSAAPTTEQHLPADHAPRLPSITGLRFVGAFGVFAYHVLGMLPNWHLTRPILMAGQAGVSFFFVLSGFVLTWSDRPGDPARKFWQRRAARILPTYLVTWVIGIPMAMLRFGSWPGFWPLLCGLTLTQAWIPDKSVFFGVNGVAWSLSVEALFYTAFPALVRLVRRASQTARLGGMALCVIVLASIQLGCWYSVGNLVGDAARQPFWLISVLPLSRLPEFVLGMLAAAYLKKAPEWRIGVGPAALLAFVAAYAAGCFPVVVVAGWLTVVPFAVLICAAASADVRGKSSVFARRWAVRLGEWSFAFYMSHQLVLRLIAWLWPSNRLPLVEILVDLLLAVMVSALLYRYVEVPAERRLRPPAKA
jgi:peptidoglycan/LPS O-acetylase OafA/YrhL